MVFLRHHLNRRHISEAAVVSHWKLTIGLDRGGILYAMVYDREWKNAPVRRAGILNWSTIIAKSAEVNRLLRNMVAI